jgi:Ca-activated chloride channel family protein
MTVDRSGSMQALDFKINDEPVDRLEAIKKVFREFVEGDGKLAGRPDDLIGLVAFGGFAEAKCPLTFDHPALLSVLDDVKIPQPIFNSQRQIINERLLNEESATAIGDAIAMSVERLKPVKAKSKIIILLTDGESNAGVLQPLEAAKIAKTYGIKIYTIGLGSNGPVPFPTFDMFGRKVMTRQVFPLDKTTLKGIAEMTGGKYFNVSTGTIDLGNIYTRLIAGAEKKELEAQTIQQYEEKFQIFLTIALMALCVETMISERKKRENNDNVSK